MKVKELIKKLQKVDGDYIVVQRGYEGGMDDIDFEIGEIYKLKEHPSYWGAYERKRKGEGEPIKAVILGDAG